MVSVDTQYLTLSESADLIRRRELSPVDLTEASLRRIEELDGRVNSFITVTADLAREQAATATRELAQGIDRGPLQGIPVALKDLFATKGIRTTAHSKVLIDWLPSEDATVTKKLREAGAVLVGKLAMHEFAYSPVTFDTPFPPARNPWNLDHVTGGSSSGSGAALAAGLCFGTLGSDTGGSIRNPASQCGTAGLKATYGRISRTGVVPLSWSLDHAGPMARSVEDVAHMLQALAGYDPRDPASADRPVPDYSAGLRDGVRGMRFGVPREWLHEGVGTDPEVLAAFEESLRVFKDLGATIDDVDSQPFIDARRPQTMIIVAEAYAYHEETIRERPQDFNEKVRGRIREGAFISAADYIQAQRVRTAIRAAIGDILKTYDAILSPTTARTAEAFDDFQTETRYSVPSFTNPANLTGLPAISIPGGFSSEELPIGLQISGRAFDEATVLRIAQAYEDATDWHHRHPSL